MPFPFTRAALALAVILLAPLGVYGGAQITRALEYRFERPGGIQDDPAAKPRDLTGRSVKTPRVRITHSSDPTEAGASAYFLFADPWVGYQRGRELFLREFAAWEGVFGESGQHGGPTLDDGVTRMQTLSHVSSCAMCHNIPFGDAGAGATIPKNGGAGRNTPHLYGAGLLEMLGWQIRLQLMAIGDQDRNGWIGATESFGRRAVIRNLPKEVTGEHYSVDFGRFGDVNGDGRPDLNEVIHIIYVDGEGQRVPTARSLHAPGVAGYTLEFQIFGFGQRARTPIASTLRAFTAGAWDVHSGLQAHDPTSLIEPNGDGLAGISLAGAQQFATTPSRDRGQRRGRGGISLDDPDRDGHVEEISQGDLDLIEWYLLNHPAPAQVVRTPQALRGERLFRRIGCASCHVPDWRLSAGNQQAKDYTQRYPGDRRFFQLEVTPNPEGGMEGSVRLLSERNEGRWRPRRRAFTIRGVYSDLRAHDLGRGYHQTQYDGSTLTRFRTTPLWGVGSSAPYDHDGASLSLEASIRRHGGEAGPAARAYRQLAERDREAVLVFLRGLVLYSLATLPADVNGDGRIERSFRVAGRDTGMEIFNPEWLFNSPGQIEGPVSAPDGRRVISRALLNVREAYGVDLPYCRDTDRDGFPDVLGLSAAGLRR